MRRERRVRAVRARLALALAAADVALLALRAAGMKPSTAKVYALLKVRGVDGVSPDEARRWAGCDRLAARVAELRAEGHEVMTLRETVRGSTYARYVLREPRRQPVADYAPGELMELWGK